MMFITSSMPRGSSSTTEATMTRAEHLPMAPARSDSAWCTKLASAESASTDFEPRPRA